MSTTPPPPVVKKQPVDLNPLRTRLIKAIASISEKSVSQTRNVLDALSLRATPSKATEGAAGFPITIRPHAINRERAMKDFSTPGCLIFHVGNAILGYYDAVRAPTDTAAVAVAEKRVAFVEQIAKVGVKNYAVRGSDATGYELIDRDELAKIKKQIADADELNRGE